MNWPKNKIYFLLGLILIYALVGLVTLTLVNIGVLSQAPPSPTTTTTITSTSLEPIVIEERLEAMTDYVNNELRKENGHLELYKGIGPKAESDRQTNSEAISYYLLWTVQAQEKELFDETLDYVEEYMIHPITGHMQWRVQPNGRIIDDGGNIASDAELRTLKALFIARERWGDDRYYDLIETLSVAVETLGFTNDLLLAPYGGVSGEDDYWIADESWLSYMDFTVFETLKNERGEPWTTSYDNMKQAVLKAQIHNGLYNSQLTQGRDQGNGIDGGGYSINSLWIMVRNAESTDPELRDSARTSLDFYRQKYRTEAQLYTLYGSNGDAISSSDAPWVYALVGRAAINLEDTILAEDMIRELLERQITDEESDLYGSLPEGSEQDLRVGQFTMQESILTIQDYLALQERLASYKNNPN